MRTSRRRGRTSPFPKSDPWYDLEHDADLIAQSIAKQYQILPSKQEKLPYTEWLLLLSGIMEDTPLGQIVLIRKEDDPKRIKSFSVYEKRIHNEWRSFLANRKVKQGAKPEDFAKVFEATFAKMFG
ncbi:MAG: Gp15 family bacteriophage protein [Ruminococcus sp.]|nr:Gp15 family bacteriophage protein [Ruminococcus sp.]